MSADADSSSDPGTGSQPGPARTWQARDASSMTRGLRRFSRAVFTRANLLTTLALAAAVAICVVAVAAMRIEQDQNIQSCYGRPQYQVAVDQARLTVALGQPTDERNQSDEVQTYLVNFATYLDSIQQNGMEQCDQTR